ncbi:MAG: 2-oxo acid dehydrogenase subunit E2 [Phycisphaeraceae bacterium]|nr:2-oxo acid dehydrogenase subunit E2 [Phycisphaeraceae bacterium]
MAHSKSTANPNDFILPDLGEGVHEAELIAWKVTVGQKVAEHDILAEMETDKALVEVPSPRAGVIAVLHGEPGQILKVGNALVTYEGAAPSGGGLPVTRVSEAQASPAEPKAEPAPESSDDYERSEDDGTVVGRMTKMEAAPGKVLATPAVRRLARDLGVDINSVHGSGIAGRVTEKDVRGLTGKSNGKRGHAPAPTVTVAPAARRATTPPPSAATRTPAPPPRAAAAIPAGEDSIRIPFRGVRRTIANRLRESVNQAVHFNVMDEADVSELDILRRKLAAASGEKVSFLPFVASAVCRVLSSESFRAMNATVDERAGDETYEAAIVQHRAVHLGIATDTDAGLMVPVIRDCDALGVLEIGRQISGIATAARNRSIPREQLTGSTFTISNVGSHAGRFATPIINYPEVAILAVGRGRQSPVVRGGGIFVGQLLPLSLACDHRVVDGATAALALAKVIELLQDPEQLMAPARG